jgi:hypothetical protein
VEAILFIVDGHFLSIKTEIKSNDLDLGDLCGLDDFDDFDIDDSLDRLVVSFLDVWSISLKVQEHAPNQIFDVNRKTLIEKINFINRNTVEIIQWRDDSVNNPDLSDRCKESIKDAYCKCVDAFVNINKLLIKIHPDNGVNIPLLNELPSRQI